jgi:hypothetical protein
MSGWIQMVLVLWLPTSPTPVGVPPPIHFYCNVGYSVADCRLKLARLQDVLVRLNPAQLGEWTWILVRSEDWKPILRRVGRDPDSPAFTILASRQTFLEDALFDADPVRSRTLLERWRVPRDKLLAFAVAHELGHAVCAETNEASAIRYAEQLLGRGAAECARHLSSER